jgi:hypothetical protein
MANARESGDVGSTAALAQAENRSSRRLRQLKAGIIVFNERRSTLACTIRDISDSGARLRLGSVVTLPEDFELIFVNDRKIVPVRKCWHTHPECGIVFVGAMQTAPPFSTPQS